MPLAVAADRIAMTAMRAARLLAKVHDSGESVDRSGKTHRFVEVYPAAALKTWGLRFKSYKSKGLEKEDKRDKIICHLASGKRASASPTRFDLGAGNRTTSSLHSWQPSSLEQLQPDAANRFPMRTATTPRKKAGSRCRCPTASPGWLPTTMELRST